MFEWIVGTIGVLVISTTGIQIGRGFYYLGCFKKRTIDSVRFVKNVGKKLLKYFVKSQLNSLYM